MAAENATMPINGAYAPQQPPSYATTEQNLATHNANSANGPPPSTSAASNTASSNAEISKEEVGWYFVERYYTTLSKNPEKLYLFYNKRSQSVFGVEEEKAPVCVGQRAINDRMKELDFQDCKVRVTNVDSQAAGSDIVIQVIGEISNKSAPHRKFVQTFVLATQTNGYFVLNDVFRYIAEEEEPVEQEETRSSPNAEAATTGYQEPVPTVEETEPKTLTNSGEVVERAHDAHLVDEELEKVIQEEDKADPSPPAQVNGTPVPESANVAQPEEASAVTSADSGTSVAEETVPATTATEPDLQPEKPKDPTPSPAHAPTPAAPPVSAAPKAPAAPPKPAAPKTWASLAASANRTAPSAAPAVSAPTPTQQKTVQQPQTQTATPPAAPAATAPPVRASSPAEGQQGDGWQAVGGEHNRKQSRAQGQAGNETPRFRAYIKNVYPSVDGSALRTQLSKYGELSYFDISHQKNCAFVDFATLEGFQAAVNANPHQVGSDQIYVEERRERPYQYAPRGGIRGGRGGNDTRPGQGRGGFGGKENVRPGGFQPRGGRGGNVTPRGRGGAQVV